MSRQSELAALGRVSDTGALSNRNLIINSAMQVAQRGNSTGVTASGYYGPDRFQFAESGRDQFQVSISQASDGPEGYSNSWKMETTTAETAVDSSEYVICVQRMEGQNLQHLKYGTSGAQQLTASFWVKSSVAAVFGIYMYAGDGVRVIGSTYTINSANTWEYKTVTFVGDTGGTINNDNGDGLYLAFVLAAGSDMRTTDNTSWSGYAGGKLAYGHTAAANAVITTSGATWQITGVQLEVGDTATEFEHEPYSVTLQKCERYFAVNIPTSGKGNNNGTLAAWLLPFRVEMRATPTVSVRSLTYHCDEYWAAARTMSSVAYLYGYGLSGQGVGVVANVACNANCVIGIEAGALGLDAEL